MGQISMRQVFKISKQSKGNLTNTNLLVIFVVCFNATFNNISAISWRPVLVVEEAGENHRPWASNW
jgi:hypothetical protein